MARRIDERRQQRRTAGGAAGANLAPSLYPTHAGLSADAAAATASVAAVSAPSPSAPAGPSSSSAVAAAHGSKHAAAAAGSMACAACGRTQKADRNIALSRCAGCRAVSYCGRSCQKRDWPLHKSVCRWTRLMDLHDMQWIKMQSTVPGNFHREDAHAITAMGTASTQSSLPPASSPIAESNLPPPTSEAAPADAASSSRARRRSRATRLAPSPSDLGPSFFVGSSGVPAAAAAVPSASSDVMAALESNHGPDSGSGSDSGGANGSSDSEEEGNDDPLRCAPSPVRHTALNAGRQSQPHGKKRRKHDHTRAASSKAQRHSGGRDARTHDGSANGELMDLEHGVTAEDASSSSRLFSALPPLQLRPFVVPPSAAPLSLALITQLAVAPETSSAAALLAAYGPRPSVGDACLLSFQARFSSGAIWSKNRAIWFHSSASSSAVHGPAAVGDAARRTFFNASTAEWIHETVESDHRAHTNAAAASTAATSFTVHAANPVASSHAVHSHAAPPSAAASSSSFAHAALASSSPSAAALSSASSVAAAAPVPSASFAQPPIVCRSPLRFVLGSGELLPSLESAVSTMFRGESCVIATRDHNRTLCVFELQLIDFGSHL